jgi:hypothetical protein
MDRQITTTAPMSSIGHTDDVTGRTPTLCRGVWELILFRLADLNDEHHFATIATNEALFALALIQNRPKPCDDPTGESRDHETMIDFEFTIPPGFLGSLKALSIARLVCKSWHTLLESNVWWYTYWSKRGIRDIRAFKPERFTWWAGNQ